jgi:hypothetical protein
MKMQTNFSLFASISKTQVKKLTREVKEILAADFSCNQNKTFCVADMWNIQRQGKSRTQRRCFTY